MQTVVVRSALGLTGPAVTYAGTSPALTDIAAGNVDAMFAPIDVATPLIDGGRVRPIAITGRNRLERFPNLPTLVESLPDLPEVAAWFGLFGPARMPAETVSQIQAAVAVALQGERLRTRMLAAGGETSPMTPAEFRSFLERDLELWRNIARMGNIQPQ